MRRRVVKTRTGSRWQGSKKGWLKKGIKDTDHKKEWKHEQRLSNKYTLGS